jgi:PAS domain S-box-containing protein
LQKNVNLIAVDWVFIDVNNSYEQAVGLRKDQIVGKKVSELFPDEPNDPADWIGKYGQVALTGVPIRFEEYRKSLKKWLSVSSYSPERGYFIALFQDITERKKAEKKLEDYRNNLEMLVEERTKQLKDSERLAAIGATAGMVGHDIRNPLQAITGDLYLVKTELAELPDNVQKQNALEGLDEIQSNIDYINKIVADLQDYARPLNPRAQEANIKWIFNEMLTKNGIPENIKVDVKIEEEVEKILADPDYLKRIAANLILNAVQAMPKGGTLTIRAYADKQTNDALIIVEDTGVGIPEDVKPKLFMPMMTTKSKGQGFGLAVVKRMTEGLGGTVTFESQEGKGTTFIVRLPPPTKS